MSIRFYTDTHIAKQVALQLRAKGIEVVRCEEVGMAQADDEAHLEYAVANNLALVTKDDDFLTLHSQWEMEGREHFGIFYCPYRDRPVIGLIVTVCSEYYALVAHGVGTLDEVKNQVTYIT